MSFETRKGKKLRIAITSDFFYPNLGGVENHMFSLAYCLMERGHKVIVLTRCYDERTGVRYLPNGIKCYYMPVFKNRGASKMLYLGVVCDLFPLVRNICIRESIDVIHLHQADAVIGFNISYFNQALNIPIIRTDHSLNQLDNPS